MEHINSKKLLNEGTKQVIETLETQPFVIVVKTDPINEYAPDIMVTIMTADPLNAIFLAGRIVDLYKNRFKCEPVVEMQPFLQVDPNDK